MKKIILGMLYFVAIFGQAQEKVIEPTFSGEAFIIENDNSILNLEKEQVQFKTKAGVGLYLSGIGKVKTKIDIPGCCSSTNYNPSNEIKLVVRAVDNETDPLSIIQIFKFTKKKNKRLAELASFGTFSGGSSNNLDYLKFTAEKYGEKSYILTITEFDSENEYGVIVNNPNSLDQKNTIVSTFGIK
tara:strand:+ start:129117 stop:129674 length:558 start_codon:yes stop_codon:yes gene_type:complete